MHNKQLADCVMSEQPSRLYQLTPSQLHFYRLIFHNLEASKSESFKTTCMLTAVWKHFQDTVDIFFSSGKEVLYAFKWLASDTLLLLCCSWLFYQCSQPLSPIILTSAISCTAGYLHDLLRYFVRTKLFFFFFLQFGCWLWHPVPPSLDWVWLHSLSFQLQLSYVA